MLNFLVYVIGMLLMFAGIFSLTLTLIRRINDLSLKYVFAVSSCLGILAGITIYVAKRVEPKKLLRFLTLLNRRLLAVASVLVLVALLLLLLSLLFNRWRRFAGGTVDSKEAELQIVRTLRFAALTGFSLSLIPLIAYLLPQMFLKTAEFVAFNEESISTGTLFRLIGYAAGCLLAFLFGLSLFQVYKRLAAGCLYGFACLNYLLLLLDLGMRGISGAARLNWLSSRNNFVFAIMVFEDRSLPYFATIYLLMALLLSVSVYAAHRKLQGEFPTPAKRRKAAWWQRNCRRWSVSLAVFALLCTLTLTAVSSYITRPVKLTPPENYTTEGDQIIIDLQQVQDGHLHRFAYNYQQHNIRFIVVRKPNSNAYGVGLDACSICGIAGYFERGDNVVCKRCDVVMNKATIGFLGGCNPVPFPYVVQDGRIIINKADLEKEANRFPIGA